MSKLIEDSAAYDGSLESYALQFSKLKVARRGGHTSPHKPCMLLAVIDLAEAGDLESNRIRYEPALLDRYSEYFAAVRTETDHPNSYFPFFHLKGEPFWHLVAIDGREPFLAALKSARRHRDVQENVDHVRLDDALHQLLQQSKPRQRLRDVLIARWFPGRDAGVRTVIGRRAPENDAERAIRTGEEIAPTVDRPVRDSAFRRVVLEVYDYRCAATGMRLLVPGVGALMDAAHLIPFAQSRDDSPTNGIALTPTFHRALDRYLIAPGPDFKWHVSKALDARISDYKPLLDLNGQQILFYGEERYRPSKDALAWRVERLLER